MPPVAVAIGAAAAAYGAASAASALGITAAITGTIAAALPSLAITVGGVTSAIGFAAFTAVSFIGNSLISKKSKGDSPSFDATAQGQLVSARNPVAPQRLIYGQVRSGGTPAFEGSHGSTGTNTPNSLLYIALAFTGHEAAELGDLYFDDVIVPLTSASHGFTSSGSRYDGTNSATGEQWVLLEKHLGTDTDEASPLLLGAGIGWTSAHRGQGISKLVFRLANSVDIWPTGVPNITCVVKGKKVYDPRTESTGWSDNWALCVADWICDAKFGLGADYDTEIDETALIAAANICDEVVNVSNESYAGSSDGVTLDITITTQRVPRIGDYFLIGSSNYYVTSVSERQRPGNEQRRFLVTFNTDLTNARLGFTASIPVGSITAIRVGEPRYTVNGIVDAGRRRQDVLEDLRAAGAGAVIYQGGKWRILAGAWRAPTVTLDESDLRGPVRFQTKLSGRDGGNTKGIKGVFADPSALWQPTDYPAVANAGYVAPDNGDETWSDLDQPFAGSPSLCQRVAKIAAERLRRPINGTFPMKLTAFRVAAGDVVNLSLARYGWDSPLKAFEVQSWKFAIDQDDQGNPILGVDLTLRELDENAFAWSVTDEMPLPAAPATGLPDPWIVQPPSGVALQSGTDQLFVAGDGTVVSRIRATWIASQDGFSVQSEIGWRRSGASAWQSVILPAGAEEHFIAPVEDGALYDVRVRAINALGVASVYTIVTGHLVIGKTSAPSTPTGFAVTALADGTRRLSWNAVSDADVRAGGGYKVRYHASASDWDSMTPLHQGTLVFSPLETNELQAGTYNFALKAIDGSGNESATAASLSAVVLPNPRLSNAIYSSDERAAGFPGPKTDCYVTIDGTLIAASAISSLAATIADLEDTIVELGSPAASPILYETDVIDLGVDVRFTPVVSAIGSGTATVTMQTGTNADGAPVGSFVALASVTARYIKIKVSMPGTDPYVETLQIILDAPAQIEVFEDLSTAASSTYLNRIAAGHFEVGSRGLIAAISTARIVAIQNVGPGYTWELISKAGTLNSKPAAEFKLYNGSGTLADATIDVELKGPKA